MSPASFMHKPSFLLREIYASLNRGPKYAHALSSTTKRRRLHLVVWDRIEREGEESKRRSLWRLTLSLRFVLKASSSFFGRKRSSPFLHIFSSVTVAFFSREKKKTFSRGKASESGGALFLSPFCSANSECQERPTAALVSPLGDPATKKEREKGG